MPSFRRVRTRLRLRERYRDPVAAKRSAQLRWWLEQWDPVIRAGGMYPGDVLAFVDDEQLDATYLGRRRQLACSQVGRVVSEAGLGDVSFFEGKVMVEVGPGPVGFPDACPARISVGVDPLAEDYARNGLLLPDSPAIYLTAGAEAIPLLSGAADVVLLRNTLDFVDDPDRAMAESRRILGPGGTLIALFDVDHAPSPSQPNALSLAWAGAALEGMTIIREHRWDEPFGHDGHRVVIVARAAGDRAGLEPPTGREAPPAHSAPETG